MRKDLKIAWPAPGKYLVAVSGGVDSTVVLDILAHCRDYDLVVAHYDHGIRSDSARDLELVARQADNLELPFEAAAGYLGPVSEDVARTHRYTFLRQAKTKYGAMAIITGHHQGDLIETSLLNLARGAGRHGLVPFARQSDVIRPLLQVPKAELVDYAKYHKLMWREDSTNQDLTNPRNFLRQSLLSGAAPGWLEEYSALISKVQKINFLIDQELRQALPVTRISSRESIIRRSDVQRLSLSQLEAALETVLRDLWPGLPLSRPAITELAWWLKRANSGTSRRFGVFTVKSNQINGVFVITKHVSLKLPFEHE